MNARKVIVVVAGLAALVLVVRAIARPRSAPHVPDYFINPTLDPDIFRPTVSI